jgi:UDP-glucuronate 4-epimerase
LLKEKILVTGCAGFIGMHLCESLLKDSYIVYGIDNLNNYYDVKLKKDRLKRLKKSKNFNFLKLDITHKKNLFSAFNKFNPDKVVNLAAQAGVRYSIENPNAYINSNIVGFMNILECARNYEVEGLIYASSSSIYGGNTKVPFSVDDRTDNPISIYAASKKANELMAATYSNLYNLNTTGLRFFTVYGPWGRPDMALYIFTRHILEGKPISVFNNGDMERDFTYIDDIITGVRSAIDKNYKCEIFNLGNNKTENLNEFISLIEKNLNMEAKKFFMPMQLGDVKKTYADIEKSIKKLDFYPKTSINSGIPKFINWFREYNN